MIVYGEFELLLADDNNIFAYKRVLNDSMILVLCNFTKDPVEYTLPPEIEKSEKNILIANYKDNLSDNKLRPYEARMYKIIIKHAGNDNPE